MEKDDKWEWKEGETSNYTIKSAYRILKGEVEGGRHVHVREFLED